MSWDIKHRRTCAFAIEILRPRWTYAILAACAAHPHLHPADVVRLLTEANRRNTPATGTRALAYDTIAGKINELYRGGLLVRCDGNADHGGHTNYDLTRLGASLVASLTDLGTWGLANYSQLVRATRLRHGIPASPVPPALDPPDAYTRRLATGMSLGVLDYRWAFTILVHCSFGPIGPGALEQRINANLASIPDLATYRRLTTGPRQSTLKWLHRTGLLTRQADPLPGQPSRVLYQTSAMGDGLLAALHPVADWGVAHDRELYRIVADRAGWPVDRH